MNESGVVVNNSMAVIPSDEFLWLSHIQADVHFNSTLAHVMWLNFISSPVSLIS